MVYLIQDKEVKDPETCNLPAKEQLREIRSKNLLSDALALVNVRLSRNIVDMKISSYS